MIFALLLSAMAQHAIGQASGAAGPENGAAASAPAPAITVSSLRSDCIAGINGDRMAGYRCSDTVSGYAAMISADASAHSTCLASAHGPASDAVWNWLTWIKEHPSGDDAPAETSVSASILDKWPCGWTED